MNSKILFIFAALFMVFLDIGDALSSCIKVDKSEFIFLDNGQDNCSNKSDRGILKIYNNDNAGEATKLSSLISGKNNRGYTVHFTFQKSGKKTNGEQILFAAYEEMSGGNAIARAGIRNSNFFYETNGKTIKQIDLHKLGDRSLNNPHAAIIVYNEKRQKLIINIDGAEVYTANVEPITSSKISRVEFGKNYVGQIGVMNMYATTIGFVQRSELSNILSNIDKKIKVIAPIDKNGIMVSGIEGKDIESCNDGEKLIDSRCFSTSIDFLTKPQNISFSQDEISYDSNITENNKYEFDCNIGYVAGDITPKYWFSIEDNNIKINQEGSCIAKSYNFNDNLPDYTINPGDLSYDSDINQDNKVTLYCEDGYESGDISPKYWFETENNDIILKLEGNCRSNQYIFGDGNSPNLPDNVIDPGVILYDVNLTSNNIAPLSCAEGYGPSFDLGYYFNDMELEITGQCGSIGDTIISNPALTVRFCEHGNGRGRCCNKGTGSYPMNVFTKYPCPGNDALSYIQVPQGCSASIWQHGCFGCGTKWKFNAGNHNLSGSANDQASYGQVTCNDPVAKPAFTFGKNGNPDLPNNAIADTIVPYDTSLTKNNLGEIRCKSGYTESGEENIGYYFENARLQVQGACEKIPEIGISFDNPAPSAKAMVDNGQTQNGVYWIDLPNAGPTQIYCALDPSFAGGGWMLAMKADIGTRFQYDSNYWEQSNNYNVDNPSRSKSDAKYDVFNYYQASEFLAIFPDMNNGGQASGYGNGWSWHVKNQNMTALARFQTNERLSGNPRGGNMWRGSGFSAQHGHQWYGFNYTSNTHSRVRWGFGWNNEHNVSSNDVTGGIGLKKGGSSAGDHIYYFPGATVGKNKRVRMEIWVK